MVGLECRRLVQFAWGGEGMTLHHPWKEKVGIPLTDGNLPSIKAYIFIDVRKDMYI